MKNTTKFSSLKPALKKDLNLILINAVKNPRGEAQYEAELTGMVVELLDRGADVDARASDDATDDATALMLAAKNGHAEIVDKLLARRANVDAVKKSTHGTALMFSAQNGHTEIVDKLLAKGVNIEAKTTSGFTALTLAAHNGHAEIVDKLLVQGANIEAIASDGFTALMVAAQNGHAETVDKLLAKGADVNAKILYGSMPLALAVIARMGYIATYDATALTLAAHNGHAEIVLALLSRDYVNWKEVLTQLSHPELQNLNKEVSILLAVALPEGEPRNSIIIEESSLLVPLISDITPDITPDGKLRNSIITSFNQRNRENAIQQENNDILGAGPKAYKNLKDLESWYKRYLTDSGAADDKVEYLANKRFFKLLNDQDYRQGELAKDNLVTGLVSKLGSLDIASGLVDEEALVSSRKLNQEDLYKLTSKIIDSSKAANGGIETQQVLDLVAELQKDRIKTPASSIATRSAESAEQVEPPKKNWLWR